MAAANAKTLDAVFIADLHLSSEAHGCLQLAEQFLTTIAPKAHQLFILGDLVEYWVGDDAYDGSLDNVFRQLAALPGHGTKSYLMHGNRDFLLGEGFARQFNCELITADSFRLAAHSPGQSDLLLMHGDTLCTDDHEYQGMRKLLRSNQWQQEFLGLSKDERHQQARAIRQQSSDKTAQKADAICDVNPLTVAEEMAKQGVTRLLHGHTHRPASHTLDLDSASADSTTTDSTTRVATTGQRWVLGDWHPSGAIYGVMENNQVGLRHWPNGNRFEG